ncbi:TetR/AcrR family transcriptional regulator [Streptomyces antimycoticus]|uniref:TetR family transcriptional regulator n=1 Tax=Streptomyces antimycoticus TaxID=68175 RepID=A0A4D4JYX8_9ACTN|nr:TetR/AcrR family transcriptional regulator [Streptomyces antimycoticus]BBJ47275.1 TetR family transcriptional regulator [Streptomyces antimycoticus]GDY39187.1 TetR family transcriptional regulator [Streptomyces antimycoticus]
MRSEDETKSGRDLRAELVAAAVDMLARPQPIAVPSLRSIARACGVAPSAVYWHFPSEADLRSAVLDAEYASLIEAVEAALDAASDGTDRLAVAGDAYIAWALDHPGAYQLLFESADELPATRAEHGPRLQRRIVELARRVDPDAPFAAALLLWSAWHGVVSLRLHKTEWDWGMTAQEANRRLVTVLSVHRGGPAPAPDNGT